MSETTKWTAGPWCIEGDWANEDRLGGWLSYNPKCPIVMFDVTPILGTPDEIRANANLIASAPELYAALDRTQHILDRLARPKTDEGRSAVVNAWAEVVAAELDARKALAKARGES